MKKKNRIYLIVLLIMTISILFIWLRKSNYTNGIYSTQLIVTKLKSKLDSYEFVPGNLVSNTFTINYQSTVDRILTLKSQIVCVGERIKISNDSLIIDFFVLQKKGDNQFISYFRNINGIIFESEYKSNFTLPSLPSFCNAHYFYLPKPTQYSFDSYSLCLIKNKEFRDIKIHFSDRFDSFINVRNNCDTSIRSDLLEYIEFTFNNSGRDLRLKTLP